MDKKNLTMTRGNGDQVSFVEMVDILKNYILTNTEAEYMLTVGTDSQNFQYTKMVEVVALHRLGDGGIFFYRVEKLQRIKSLKQKITTETSRSLEMADGLIDDLGYALLEENIDIDEVNIAFQIHCDIGTNGATKTLVTEITNWVKNSGYDVMIKPDSYCASGIANKISK